MMIEFKVKMGKSLGVILPKEVWRSGVVLS